MKLRRSGAFIAAIILFAHLSAAKASPAPPPANSSATQKILLDTDIGDDIDDVFALGLALSSPELRIVGITSAWGDTALRSRMLDRLLCETGRDSIPVATGISKTAPGAGAFSQQPWAAAGIEHPHPDAVTFLLHQIGLDPGELTLIAIGPLTNIGAAIDRDPTTFRKLKRVVIMGGSIDRGYNSDHASTTPRPPDAEYNIAMDPAAARKLFQSGVPLYVMPLDATQIAFDESQRSLLASISTPLTDAIEILTAEWARSTHRQTPILFDAVAAAYALDPTTCPTTPLRLAVDPDGFTRIQPGPANAQVCLQPHPEAFFSLLLPRLLHQNLAGSHTCIAPAKP